MPDDVLIQNALNRYLLRFSPPRRIAGRPEAEQDEADALLRCLLNHAPTSVAKNWVARVFDTIEARAKFPTWPTVSEIDAACRSVAVESGGVSKSVTEAAMVDRLADFYKKTGAQLGSCGSPERTQALVDGGVIENLRHARFCGFDLNEHQRKIAQSQAMSSAERHHHIRVVAQLRNIPEDEVAFVLEEEELQALRPAAE